MTLACLDISSKKSCLYRLFIYHFKAHTITNKLVLKMSAQNKGEKSYDSSNMCSNFFVVSGIVPPAVFVGSLEISYKIVVRNISDLALYSVFQSFCTNFYFRHG